MEMEADIEVLIQDLQGKQESELIRAEYEAKLHTLQMELNDQRGKYLTMESKYNISQSNSTQESHLKSEVERWKSRYMQTEVRLKEFDEINLSFGDLQISYRRLQVDYESLQKDFNRI